MQHTPEYDGDSRDGRLPPEPGQEENVPPDLAEVYDSSAAAVPRSSSDTRHDADNEPGDMLQSEGAAASFPTPEGSVVDSDGDDSGTTETEDEKARSGFLEALALVFVAFALALTLKSYVAEAYEIKGRSMEPSFKTGQRVIVLKAFYEVQRSDVVVFASTEDANKDLIKRVVGLPGDQIEWRDGRVYVNGEPLQETYVEHAAPAYETSSGETVPPGRLYVLGDNRPDSHDSRYFHSIPQSNLKGEVVLRWWPFEDFGFFLK